METTVHRKLDSILRKAARKSKTLQFELSVPSIELAHDYSSARPGQVFHSASVGKLATAALAFIATERGLLSLDTPIESLLPRTLPGGLFLPGDGTAKATIGQVLGHTSGVNDYFEGITEDRRSFIDGVLADPDRLFSPLDLVRYTADHQKPVGRPGERFLYSDTGYVLLGLALEQAFGMPFHRALRTFIFDPLDMRDTALCFFDERFDPETLAPAFIRKTDVHRYRSLSCDFSGGGLATTTGDLTLFLRALQEGRLLSRTSLDAMASFGHRFRPGMLYGLGMMQLRFEGFFFLLAGMPRLQGHLGVLGVHAWYHPADGDTYVLNVGDTDGMVASFRTLIQIVRLVEDEKRKR